MQRKSRIVWLEALAGIFSLMLNQSVIGADLFAGQKFTDKDSVLVVDAENETVFEWQADTKRVPASLMKLFTAWLAIDKWGTEHRFFTDFYIDGNTLWIKGSGDPMLISEEVDLLVDALRKKLPSNLSAVGVDSSLFADVPIPGKGKSSDPYNAPLSALAINFNTVSVARVAGVLQSGESQTPLTPLAKRLVANRRLSLSNKATRINLYNALNARQQFAEVLVSKLGVKGFDSIEHGVTPASAELLYRHFNSHSLAETLRGTLEYSNNFIANQLFMLLGEREYSTDLTLQDAQSAANARLRKLAGWQNSKIHEGAGLSRANQFDAYQILAVLNGLEPNKGLLKKYQLDARKGKHAEALAKTGTLDGVHTFAGYLKINDQDYKFVFLFNRPRPYGFRETLLQSLVEDLSTKSVN